ncbi:hypothetical protein ACHAWF_007534 [Thalassiosira exigua]
MAATMPPRPRVFKTTTPRAASEASDSGNRQTMNFDEPIADPADPEGWLASAPELRRAARRDGGGGGRRRRSLGSNDDYESLLVDGRGNRYDTDSLAWRYLGVYVDCEDDDDDGGGGGGGSGDHRRRRLSGSRDEGSCQRTLLWAAYVDPRYRGNGVEEYKFYDVATGEWDETACEASGNRDGMYDWTEQLFKHEGVCLWNDDDAYEEMETWMERWPTECTQLSTSDYDGNTIYLAVQPLAEGNMTLGIYTDSGCTEISPYIDLYGYITRLFSNYYYYYGNYDKGEEVAEMYKEGIATWNEYMTSFKVCRPCRAYNLYADDEGSSGSGSDDRRRTGRRGRALGGDENDGDGEERERFNCYDDAGYTNVDQCYKFETHTTMEAADLEDLAIASEQGTILRIKAADGKVYGKGGYVSPMSDERKSVYVSIAAVLAVTLAALVYTLQGYLSRRKAMPKSLRETLNDSDSGGIEAANAPSKTPKRLLDDTHHSLDDSRRSDRGVTRKSVRDDSSTDDDTISEASVAEDVESAATNAPDHYVPPTTLGTKKKLTQYRLWQLMADSHPVTAVPVMGSIPESDLAANGKRSSFLDTDDARDQQDKENKNVAGTHSSTANHPGSSDGPRTSDAGETSNFGTDSGNDTSEETFKAQLEMLRAAGAIVGPTSSDGARLDSVQDPSRTATDSAEANSIDGVPEAGASASFIGDIQVDAHIQSDETGRNHSDAKDHAEQRETSSPTLANPKCANDAQKLDGGGDETTRASCDKSGDE